MNYYYLNPAREQFLFIDNKKDRNDVIDNIIQLRAALSAAAADPDAKSPGIPEKKLTDNLILGTWNIREFGNSKYGGRMPESYYYIAEILSRFDLVAVQEVRDNLADFNSICRILGSDWGVFTSVVTEGASGNKERMAFLYDKRTVSFRNIAGQIIRPPDKKNKTEQFARSPYVIRFQSGWLKFDICTTHIYYGNDTKSSAQYKRRVDEIQSLVDHMDKYYVKKGEANNLFILGDFNIEDEQSKTYAAATSSVFSIPDAILKKHLSGSNVKKDKIYDQILYYNKYKDINFKNAGIFDFYETVFNDFSSYASRIKKHCTRAQIAQVTDKKFNDFRTYQMSDHLPLWVEMNTDHTDSYLNGLKRRDV